MRNVQLTFLLAGLVVSLLLVMITTSVHLLAFPPIQPGSSSGSPTSTPLQQPRPLSQPQQQQTNIEGQQRSATFPGILPIPAQPITTANNVGAPTQSPVLLGGLTANGTVDSIIYAPTTKWIAIGNWSVVLNNDRVSFFTTKMTWFNDNGTKTHTHELQDFRLTEQPKITSQQGNNVLLKGLMEVGTNHRIVWHNVHTTIYIKGGKIFSISLDNKETNYHFAGQTIYGIVHSLTRCSDTPLPDMEVLPLCTSPGAATLSSTNSQPQSSTFANSGNSSTLTPNTATPSSKSPFDILGGGR